MINILMVCLGNICRSPLAEGILKSKLPKSKFNIHSAGTSAHHEGEPPDSRSIAIAKHKGIDISRQRAKQFRVSDFDTFHYIYVMDNSNYKAITKLTRTDKDIKKIKLILSELNTTNTMEVPDPYYGDNYGFETTYQILDVACDNIAKTLKQKHFKN